MLRVIPQRVLARWQQPVKRVHNNTNFDAFLASTAWRPCGRQQQQSFASGGASALLLAQHRFFTSTVKASASATAIEQQSKNLWRVLIRPHYYNNNDKSKLSQALQQQRNPFRQFGRRLNNMNPNTVLYSVIGANVAVYFMWQYAINCYRQFGDNSWLNFMAANFMNSREAIQHGHYHTLLTSAFSHKNMGHLGINMLVLYSMGQAAIEAIGASRFLLLYAGAGIAASLTTQAYQKWIRPQLVKRSFFSGHHQFGALGASGSVMGITAFYACAFPRATFLLFFVIPMPAIAVVGGLAAYDVYQAYALKNEVVDSAAHVGGAAYGAAYWFMRVRPLLKAGRWRV